MKMSFKKGILIVGIPLALILLFFIGMRAKSPQSENTQGTSLHSQAADTKTHFDRIKTPFAPLLQKASSYEEQGQWNQARDIYLDIIKNHPSDSSVAVVQNKLVNANIQLLLSNLEDPYSFMYEVKPGDSLAKIAKQHHTTIELIQKSNHLSGDKIRPGMKLKVAKAHFSIVVDKSQNQLTLKADEEIFKTYMVSTGVNNSTPVGTFTLTNKLPNPTWYKAGAIVPPDSPQNILGTRWLGISQPGYGIHGTTDPLSIGKQVTSGCVRMLNSEVEELYTLVPVGTEVTIVD